MPLLQKKKSVFRIVIIQKKESSYQPTNSSQTMPLKTQLSVNRHYSKPIILLAILLACAVFTLAVTPKPKEESTTQQQGKVQSTKVGQQVANTKEAKTPSSQAKKPHKRVVSTAVVDAIKRLLADPSVMDAVKAESDDKTSHALQEISKPTYKKREEPVQPENTNQSLKKKAVSTNLSTADSKKNSAETTATMIPSSTTTGTPNTDEKDKTKTEQFKIPQAILQKLPKEAQEKMKKMTKQELKDGLKKYLVLKKTKSLENKTPNTTLSSTKPKTAVAQSATTLIIPFKPLQATPLVPLKPAHQIGVVDSGHYSGKSITYIGLTIKMLVHPTYFTTQACSQNLKFPFKAEDNNIEIEVDPSYDSKCFWSIRGRLLLKEIRKMKHYKAYSREKISLKDQYNRVIITINKIS